MTERIDGTEARRRDPALLTDHEREVLEAAGVAVPDDGAAADLADIQRRESAAAHASVVDASLDVVEFAERTGVDPAHVRRRLDHEGTLWGFRIGSGSDWRIPGWAVTGDGELPGIDVVSPKIPAVMDPVAATRLVTLPNPDLEADGEQVSVVAWLAAGGDPAAAAAAIGRPSELA